MLDKNENRTHYLYLIQCKSNGGIYIGITVDPKTRWSNHKCGTDCPPLKASLNKYGSDDFTFDVIEEWPTKTIAKQEEIWWIAYWRTLGARVFNVHDGGGMPPPCWGRTALTKEQAEEVRAKYKPGIVKTSDLAKEYGVTSNVISKVINFSGPYAIPDGQKKKPTKPGQPRRDWSDWIGQRQGTGEIVEILDEFKNDHQIARVQCDCGILREVQINKLKRGESWEHKHCPARIAKTKIRKGKDYSDLIGKVFGLQKVISICPRTEKGKLRRAIVSCRCGKERAVAISNLLIGDSSGCRSCSARFKLKNLPTAQMS